MEKTLKIYTYDGATGGSTEFPVAGADLEIFTFDYTASRTQVPQLSATLMYKECLDSKWDYRQYTEFNGEKYWVMKKPSSSYSNSDRRYKHEISFISERALLAHIYFFDVASPSYSGETKYHSNSPDVLFYGTLKEFVERINYSLENTYAEARLTETPYHAVIADSFIDDARCSEVKEFSCSDTTIFDALSQAYETWDMPYYFSGKNIVFGDYDNEVGVVEQGSKAELLSVQRNNANIKMVTIATGKGSSENIPYYYPNDCEGGNIKFTTDINKETTDKYGGIVPASDFEIFDEQRLYQSVKTDLEYEFSDITPVAKPTDKGTYLYVKTSQSSSGEPIRVSAGDVITIDNLQANNSIYHNYQIRFSVDNLFRLAIHFALESSEIGTISLTDCGAVSLNKKVDVEGDDTVYQNIKTWYGVHSDAIEGNTLSYDGILEAGEYYISIETIDFAKRAYPLFESISYQIAALGIAVFNGEESRYAWIVKKSDEELAEVPYPIWNYRLDRLTKAGVRIGLEETWSNFRYKKFVLSITERLPYQANLMPSIYTIGSAFNGNITARDNKKGIDRFYPAYDYLYDDMVFPNPFSASNLSQHIYTFDDIKPEIKGINNAEGLPINYIIDVAYDDDDSDEIEVKSEDSSEAIYGHPYFYVKLRKFDGNMGFNLFDHASQSGEMTIQVTGGMLNGCKFQIQVVENSDGTFSNPVQVDDSGNIVAGGRTDKIKTSNIQPIQQDTRKAEVWIALKKEESTFGIVMPNAEHNYRMRILDENGLYEDSFNITNIILPKKYIRAAEERLDWEIVRSMFKNNEEDFNYSINFSRIFLKEDYDKNGSESVMSRLSEASKITVKYNGKEITQYVSSYSYKVKNNELLPEISVELSNEVRKVETLSDSITTKAAKLAVGESVKSTTEIIKGSGVANIKNKANKGVSLASYGIEDAYIKDGTIVLGNASITPLTKKDLAEQQDFFELDENGDIRVKGNRGFYSNSFISALGKDSTGTSGGGSGFDVLRMWQELKADNAANQIHISHLRDALSGYALLEDLYWNIIND